MIRLFRPFEHLQYDLKTKKEKEIVSVSDPLSLGAVKMKLYILS